MSGGSVVHFFIKSALFFFWIFKKAHSESACKALQKTLKGVVLRALPAALQRISHGFSLSVP